MSALHLIQALRGRIVQINIGQLCISHIIFFGLCGQVGVDTVDASLANTSFLSLNFLGNKEHIIFLALMTNE